MRHGAQTPGGLLAIVAVCLAVALLGQTGADALVADASGADTNRAIGRAASSYLTGLKTFAAAALWNRIDPLLHNYYGDVPLEDQRYMMTTIAAVQALDSHAVQSYYVGSWVLAMNDRQEEGLEMAERGLEANPDAGVLLVGLAQMRLLFSDDLTGAATLAERALSGDTEWTDAKERDDSLLAAGEIFDAAGREDLAAEARSLADVKSETVADSEGHDHDGDGVQDH